MGYLTGKGSDRIGYKSSCYEWWQTKVKSLLPHNTVIDMQTFSWPMLTWIASKRSMKLNWVDGTQKVFPECPRSKVQLIWDLDMHVSVCQWHGNKRRPAFNCRVNMNNEHLGPGIHLEALTDGNFSQARAGDAFTAFLKAFYAAFFDEI